MKIISSAKVTKLDVINATASKAFKSVVGQTIKVKGAAIVEDADRETGEARRFAYVWSDGAVYGGNSATVISSIEGLIDMMNEDGAPDYAVKINAVKSNGGREFLTLFISEV